MSGGSLNYVYCQVESAAYEVGQRAQTTLQRAFATHLRLVAKALHDLEWVFSDDYGPGDEEEAIRAVLNEGAELEQATREAKAAYEVLGRLLDQSKP